MPRRRLIGQACLGFCLTGPAFARVSWTFLAGRDSWVLKAVGAFEPSSTFARRSLGVIGIPISSGSVSSGPHAVRQPGYRGSVRPRRDCTASS